MIQEIFKILNQYAVDIPTLPVILSFSPHPVPGGILSCSLGMSSRREGPPSIWYTHGKSGNVFTNPVASSTTPYPQELHQWNSSVEEPLHSSTVEKVRDKHKIKIRDASLDSQPNILSSSVEETLQRIMGQTNNDCRFQTFTLTNSIHQRHLFVGR